MVFGLILSLGLSVASATTPSSAAPVCPGLSSLAGGRVHVVEPRSPLCEQGYNSQFLRILEDQARRFATRAPGRRASDDVPRSTVDAILTYLVRSTSVFCGVDDTSFSLRQFAPPLKYARVNSAGAMEYLNLLTERARVYRLRAPEHLARAGVTGANLGVVDAVLVEFINSIARSFDVEYTLYPMDLETSTATEHGTGSRG